MKIDPVEFLDRTAGLDFAGFLKNVQNWDNHRPMLLLALGYLDDVVEDTSMCVVEFGCGNGSTPYLNEFCSTVSRKFISYETDKVWSMQFDNITKHVKNYDVIKVPHDCGLLFLDHAPGERRYSDALIWNTTAKLIVAHDTEIGGAGNYMWDKAFPHFKYQLHYNRHGGGAGASLLSNYYDVSIFAGLKLANFKFDDK